MLIKNFTVYIKQKINISNLYKIKYLLSLLQIFIQSVILQLVIKRLEY